MAPKPTSHFRVPLLPLHTIVIMSVRERAAQLRNRRPQRRRPRERPLKKLGRLKLVHHRLQCLLRVAENHASVFVEKEGIPTPEKPDAIERLSTKTVRA